MNGQFKLTMLGSVDMTSLIASCLAPENSIEERHEKDWLLVAVDLWPRTPQ